MDYVIQFYAALGDLFLELLTFVATLIATLLKEKGSARPEQEPDVMPAIIQEERFGDSIDGARFEN